MSRRGREGAEGTISQKVSLQWLNIVHIPWHLLLRMFGKERKAPKGACSCCMMTSRHTLSKGFSLSGVYIVGLHSKKDKGADKFRLARPSAHELLAADPPPASYEEKRLRRVEKDAQRRKEPRFRLAHLSAHELNRSRTRPPSAHKKRRRAVVGLTVCLKSQKLQHTKKSWENTPISLLCLLRGQKSVP